MQSAIQIIQRKYSELCIQELKMAWSRSGVLQRIATRTSSEYIRQANSLAHYRLCRTQNWS
jgi:hypothetical protein